MEENNIEQSSSDKFKVINECAVDDISLDYFYEPHTVSVLLISIICISSAFFRDESNVDNNIWAGLIGICFFLVIISILAFPNGPFTRPHPAVWRVVFGFSILYLLSLLFLLFQSYQTARGIFLWIDPKLKNFRIDMDKEYGVNCSDISIEKIWAHIDVFALGHFLGWTFKAILVRHCGILWAMSIMWEVTEMAFAHLLPNFIECWWDALILDIILCNGIGIWVGLKICRILEMREYKWVSIRDIHTTTGKLKRAVLQFTPGSWTHVRWLDPNCTYMRFFAVCQMVIFWQISELNTFFLKHIFEMPPSHPMVVGRLIFLGIIVAPSARQYYSFVTDPQCKRLGSQCWVYGAVMLTESLLCIKNGKTLFGQTQAINIIAWVLVMLLLSILCVYGFVVWQWYFSDEKMMDESPLLPRKSQSLNNEYKSNLKAGSSENSHKQRPKREEMSNDSPLLVQNSQPLIEDYKSNLMAQSLEDDLRHRPKNLSNGKKIDPIAIRPVESHQKSEFLYD